MFCRVEMEVFLEVCLLLLFLFIHHDNKAHCKSSFILFCVQRDDGDDGSGDININVHSWLAVTG